ncbi:hypothetical protein [Rhodovulum sp. PH10]|uniref:hypothetical protein n=1 Tax=Rhodovulum sp. PH10 TaxID=1187851 RepID=UPI0012F8196D|nr:hypothetical protein [Rhodovulum sp. PH10]
MNQTNRVPRGPSTFREGDLSRALRATAKSGVAVERIEIAGGKLTLYPAQGRLQIEPTTIDDPTAPRLL